MTAIPLKNNESQTKLKEMKREEDSSSYTRTYFNIKEESVMFHFEIVDLDKSILFSFTVNLKKITYT